MPALVIFVPDPDINFGEPPPYGITVAVPVATNVPFEFEPIIMPFAAARGWAAEFVLKSNTAPADISIVKYVLRFIPPDKYALLPVNVIEILAVSAPPVNIIPPNEQLLNVILASLFAYMTSLGTVPVYELPEMVQFSNKIEALLQYKAPPDEPLLPENIQFFIVAFVLVLTITPPATVAVPPYILQLLIIKEQDDNAAIIPPCALDPF